jgi:hypothetical protein
MVLKNWHPPPQRRRRCPSCGTDSATADPLSPFSNSFPSTQSVQFLFCKAQTFSAYFFLKRKGLAQTFSAYFFIKRKGLAQTFSAYFFIKRKVLAQTFSAYFFLKRKDLVQTFSESAKNFPVKSFQACQNFSSICFIAQRKICKKSSVISVQKWKE